MRGSRICRTCDKCMGGTVGCLDSLAFRRLGFAASLLLLVSKQVGVEGTAAVRQRGGSFI
jgi:hypothetical protein